MPAPPPNPPPPPAWNPAPPAPPAPVEPPAPSPRPRTAISFASASLPTDGYCHRPEDLPRVFTEVDVDGRARLETASPRGCRKRPPTPSRRGAWSHRPVPVRLGARHVGFAVP